MERTPEENRLHGVIQALARHRARAASFSGENVDHVRCALRVPTPGVVPHVACRLSDTTGAGRWRNKPFTDSAHAIQSPATTFLPNLGIIKTKSLVKTAAQSGNGATKVAANPAVALVLLGKRVLSADANIRSAYLPATQLLGVVLKGGAFPDFTHRLDAVVMPHNGMSRIGGNIAAAHHEGGDRHLVDSLHRG